jgi:hypothetical protein
MDILYLQNLFKLKMRMINQLENEIVASEVEYKTKIEMKIEEVIK